VVAYIAAGNFILIPPSSLITPEAFSNPVYRIVYSTALALDAKGLKVCLESINDYIAFHDLDPEIQRAIDSTRTVPWTIWSQDLDTSYLYSPTTISVEYALSELDHLYRNRQAAQIGSQLEQGILELRAAIAGLQDIENSSSSNGSRIELLTRRFDFDHPPQKPIPIFLLADQTIATPGNLVSLYSQAKTGKSAALSAMMAAAISQEHDQALLDFLGFSAAPNPMHFALVHFDTEQSRFDADQLIRRSLRRAQLDRPPSWLRSYCLTDLSIPQRRNLLHAELHAAQKECGGLYAVLLDGVGDLAIDVNDPSESNTLVTELHGLAITFSCPIIGVLHENPGDKKIDKQRGHLGSQLERKVESNIRLLKDADGTTVIYTDKSRHASVPRSNGPRFKWSPSLQMHASTSNESFSSQNSADLVALKHFTQEIYNCPEATGGMTWKQIHERIALLTNLKEGGCRKRFAKLLAHNLIEKNSAGFYLINNP
jgi:hypothetical protein